MLYGCSSGLKECVTLCKQAHKEKFVYTYKSSCSTIFNNGLICNKKAINHSKRTEFCFNKCATTTYTYYGTRLF